MASSKYHSHKIAKEILVLLLKSGGQILRDSLKNSLEEKSKKSYYSLRNLSVTGSVQISEKNGLTVVKITKKGEEKALKYSISDINIKIPEKWDNKWRIVIFDIPDKYRVGRHVLKGKLDELGFKALQESVYIFPFQCADEIEFIRTVYRLQPYVKILTATNIEGEEKYLKHYKLHR